MNAQTKIIKQFTLIALLSLVSACGGDLSNSYSSSVDEVSMRDKSIIPGAQTTVRVRLSPGAEYTGQDSDGDSTYTSEAFALTVKLPKEVSLVNHTSRLSEDLLGDILFGNPDPKDPIEQGECKNGEKFVRYFFERGEFGDPNQISIASVFLKLDIIVPQSASGKEVGAAIAWQKDACEEPSDKLTKLVVAR